MHKQLPLQAPLPHLFTFQPEAQLLSKDQEAAAITAQGIIHFHGLRRLQQVFHLAQQAAQRAQLPQIQQALF